VAEAWVWALASVIFVSLLSLVGVLGLAFRRVNSHGVMLFLVALAAGTLLGDSLLHIIPEAAAARGGITASMGALILAGFVVLFILEAGLRWRHSHAERLDDHGHDHAHGHVEPFGWLNLIGDGVHNLIDGAVIAAAYMVDVHVGLATTVAVAMHEIPQELGDFAVLVKAGMTPAKALLFNLASAGIALVGAGLVWVSGLSAEQLESVALPLIAGAFLYIAAADLVPELHHHSRGREVGAIMVALFLGIALMALLLQVEIGHTH
jgi:zinc and cadmium transporter